MTFVLVQGVARVLPANATSGLTDLTVRATGHDLAKRPAKPVVTDVAGEGDKAVVRLLEPIELQADSADTRAWRIPLVVKDLPATGATTARTLKVVWGDAQAELPYMLSNAAAPVVTMKVSGLPAEWALIKQQCQRLRIAVTGGRATGVLLTSTLVEQSTKRALADTLFLTFDGTTLATPAQLEAAVNNESGEPILLCVKEAGAAPGKYMGAVNVSAAEKSDGDAVTLTVWATTAPAQFLGGLLLLVGVIGAYVVRIRAPASLARRQALLPASLLRERVGELRAHLDALTVAAPTTRAKLQQVESDLDETTLSAKGLIPASIPLPFGGASDATAYKALLDARSAFLDQTDVVIEEGFTPALQIGGAKLAAVLKLLDDLAATFPTVRPLAQVRTDITAALAQLRDAQQARLESFEPPPVAVSNTQRLLFQIAEISTGVWLTWTALTFFIGLFMLVLNNPGFGVPLDYLFCLGWGFGLPAVAAQMTSSSGTTALGITMPKTS